MLVKTVKYQSFLGLRQASPWVSLVYIGSLLIIVLLAIFLNYWRRLSTEISPGNVVPNLRIGRTISLNDKPHSYGKIFFEDPPPSYEEIEDLEEAAGATGNVDNVDVIDEIVTEEE